MASIRDFVFGFRLEVVDHLSGVLKNVEKRIEGINAAAAKTAGMREAAGTLATMGVVAVGAGTAVGYGLWKITESAMKADDATRHMLTAFDQSAPAAQQAQHLAETLKMVKEVSQQTGISQDALKDSVYNAKMMMLSDAQANAVAAVSAKLAIGTTHDLAAARAATADTSLMLATAQNVLGGSASDLSDKFALLQSHYGFKELPQLKAAMDYVLPSMKGLKMEANDTFAAMAVLSTSGYQADRIGTGLHEVISKLTTGHAAFRAIVVANKEGGPDLEKTTERLSAMTSGMTALQRASYLKTLGFDLRDVQVMETLLDGVKKFGAARADMSKSKGATDALFNIRSQGTDQQWGKMWNNLDILRETLGTSLLPAFTTLISKVNSLVVGITDFAEKHPTIMKYAVGFAAITSAVLLVGGGLMLASSALLGFVSFVPAIKAVGAAFQLGAVATKVWTAAQWLLNGAMAANPVALGIIAAAALAVAAYEVYEHWAAVKAFFMSWGKASTWKSVFEPLAGWLKSGLIVPIGMALGAAVTAVKAFAGHLYDAGASLMKQLVAGIESMAMAPVHAVEKMAAAIRSYLPFSPARTGPLRELSRVRIVETIAEKIRPGPVTAAMRRVAAATAVAMPLVFAPALSLGALSPRISPVIKTPDTAATLQAIEAIRPALKIAAPSPHISPVIKTPDTAATLHAIEAIRPALSLATDTAATLHAIEAIRPALKIDALSPHISPVIKTPDTAPMLRAIEAIKPVLKLAALSPHISPVIKTPDTAPVMAAPVMAAPAFSGVRAGVSPANGAAQIIVHAPISITLKGADAQSTDKLFRVLEAHRSRLANMIADELDHRERRKY